ncbi:MAG: hypothetical protein ACRDWE_14495 [Acidimicrobiales bacterium]
MTGAEGAGLDELAAILDRIGYPSTRLDRHPEVPVPTLLVVAPQEDADPLPFNAMYVPVDEEGFEHLDLLQLYFSVHEGVGDAHRAAVCLVLAQVNAQIPVGQVGLQDDDVMLRHVLLLERGSLLSEGALAEALSFLLFLRKTLADVVGAVARGDMAPEAALSSLP